MKFSSMALPLAATLVPQALAAPLAANESSALVERQDRCLVYSPTSTELVGDGSPHKNIRHVQVTGRHTCSDSTGCEIGYQEAETLSFSFQASISPVEWISGGFAVSKEFQTGTVSTCYGDPGETICIWQAKPHAAYTVKNIECSPCGSCRDTQEKPFVIKSPFTDKESTYCAKGKECRERLGANYWDNKPRPL